MAIDWKLLVDTRIRKKTAALEVVAQDRQALENSLAQVTRAKSVEQEYVLNKAQLWQATMATPANGTLPVAQLRNVSAWSHALDAHIVQAAQDVCQAQQVTQQRLTTLEVSRSALVRACRNLDKAEQLQQRARLEHIHAQEGAAQCAADDNAGSQWIRTRAD